MLDLDPGMAFGTGLHPTTQLVLEVLEDLDDGGEVQGRELLDLGTGSGILAIGAGRLGAASVLALDVDEVAVAPRRRTWPGTACRASCASSGARSATRRRASSRCPGSTLEEAFDGALANIVARVIAERAPALARALRPGAWLVASGIIAEREAEASGPLEAQGLRTERRLQRGDWVTLLCRAPGVHPFPGHSLIATPLEVGRCAPLDFGGPPGCSYPGGGPGGAWSPRARRASCPPCTASTSPGPWRPAWSTSRAQPRTRY